MWPAHVGLGVESILERHFAERAGEHSHRSKSATAAIADKCSASGYQSYKCPAKGCKTGIHWATGSVCATCKGVGCLHKKVKLVAEQSKRCKACKGGGRSLAGDLETAASYRGAVLLVDTLPACPVCEGAGYLTGYDARPDPEKVIGRPAAPEPTTRAPDLETSAVLAQLQRIDPEAETCIRLMHAEFSTLKLRLRNRVLVELVQSIGVEFMLWPLTSHGKQLVERERRREGAQTPPHLALLRAMQRTETDGDELASQLGSMARLEAAGLRQRAMAKLCQADEQTGGYLQRTAEAESRRLAA